ncbi:hypothetical protein AB4Y34_12420 [Paraburkholderia sp. BR10954]
MSYTVIEEQRCDTLWLLEDVSAPDKPVWTNDEGTTGYTLLEAFVHYARDKLLASSLVAKLKVLGLRVGSDRDNSLDSDALDWSPEWHAFASDPILATKELGCVASSPRKIETLYRMREVGPAHAGETDGPRPGYALFGYPLWIAAV